jgi:hypothetical protein
VPKRQILEMCEKTIRMELGSLDDLPQELANTVENVYYRFFNLSMDVMKDAAGNPGQIDLNYNPEVANKLFDLVNIIADVMISQPT